MEQHKVCSANSIHQLERKINELSHPPECMITSDLRVLNHKLQEIGHVEKRDSEFVYMLHGLDDSGIENKKPYSLEDSKERCLESKNKLPDDFSKVTTNWNKLKQ